MNPLLLKALPYAGWPLAALMFWFWIGGKEDLAAQVEKCNTEKMQSVAEAEALTRIKLQEAIAAHEKEKQRLEAHWQSLMDQLEIQVTDLTASSDQMKQRIRDLMRDAANNENATVEEACLNVDVPVTLVDGLR